MFRSTKTYGHSLGLSACFRQHRADHSHCSKLHGYALGFRFEFQAATLDDRNWVVDFGGLKSLKAALEKAFDHKTVVAQDDPHLEWFERGHELGLLDLVVVPAVGCEQFALQAACLALEWLRDSGHSPRVSLALVEVTEHGANSAVWLPGGDNE